MKTLFTDETHGDAAVIQLEKYSSIAVPHRLFGVAQDGFTVALTGEQLDSLARQWLEWRKANP